MSARREPLGASTSVCSFAKRKHGFVQGSYSPLRGWTTLGGCWEKQSVPWLILFVAGLLEIGWAVGLKYSEGFSRPLPSVLTVLAMVASMGLLGIAARTLPIGTAYAIWTGIGAVGAVVLGVIIFGESASLARLACLALIVTGMVGLKLFHS